MPLAALLILAIAYLVGSFPTGYLLVRLFLKQDIRTLGSGNTGTTNVLRTGAKGLSAATLLLDIFKGSLAVWLSIYFTAHWLPSLGNPDAQLIPLLAAFCCVGGHIFPIWLGFKGGKGVATGFGVFLMICPWAALIALGIFVTVIALTRYVSLGSMLSAVAFPFLAWIWAPAVHPPLSFVILCATPLLLILKHHQNITRLLQGTESKIGAKKTV